MSPHTRVKVLNALRLALSEPNLHQATREEIRETLVQLVAEEREHSEQRERARYHIGDSQRPDKDGI